jgi:hypothetical protein
MMPIALTATQLREIKQAARTVLRPAANLS